LTQLAISVRLNSVARPLRIEYPGALFHGRTGEGQS
jgi:hypothetical protein